MQPWSKSNLHHKDEVGELVEMRPIEEPESEPIQNNSSSAKQEWPARCGITTLQETK